MRTPHFASTASAAPSPVAALEAPHAGPLAPDAGPLAPPASPEEAQVHGAREAWLPDLFDGTYRGLFATLLAVAAAAAALCALAAAQPAHVSPETWYLALTSSLLLLSVALLAPPPRREARVAALFATALLWLLPVGPQRGAVVSALLLVALTVALVRRVAAPRPALPVGAALAAALGLQVFMRSEALLPATLDSTALLRLGLPVLALGAAAWWLGRREPRTALVAGGVAILAAGGVTATAAASLVAAAATLQVRETVASRSGSLRRPELILAVAGLVMVGLWNPRLGILAAAGALLLAVPSRVAMAAPALALALGLGLPAPAAEPTQTLWLAPILLPTALVLAASKPRLVAGGSLLVVAGALLLPGTAGLALPLALLALHFDPRRAALRAQEVWLGLLFVPTLVAAAYPWLRNDPLLWTLELAAAPWWVLAGLACFLVNGLAVIQRHHRRPALAAVCLGLGLVALRLGAPHAGVGTELLAGVPLSVDSERKSWQWEIEPAQTVGRLLVDSSLANSTGLEPGTVVATVVLEAGDHSTRWPLRAGEETGEWAARRIRAQGGAPPAASAWITWVAPPGHHFGQWYRARRQLAEPLEGVTSIRLERGPGLPAEASFSVSRLELLP